jgi:hypothetical protein
MKILIFTEGTILMHKAALGLSREAAVEQVINKNTSVKDYASYIPIKSAVAKIRKWVEPGVELIYLTSRRIEKETADISSVLAKYNFPEGPLEYRRINEAYKDVVERVQPDIFIEDDCESIGQEEIAVNSAKDDIKENIKSIIVKEFYGIDYLPDNINDLKNLK